MSQDAHEPLTGAEIHFDMESNDGSIDGDHSFGVFRISVGILHVSFGRLHVSFDTLPVSVTIR